MASRSAYRETTADAIASIRTLSAGVCDEFAPSTSGATRRKVHVNAVMRDWFLNMCDAWKSERRCDMQQCMSEVREAVSWTARRDQPEHTLSLETERSASSSTRQQEHSVARRLDAPDRVHHVCDWCTVLKCRHGPRLGARMARRNGTRCPSQRVLDQTALAWHGIEPQEARQMRARAPQPCSAARQRASTDHQTVLAHGQALCERRTRGQHRRHVIPSLASADDRGRRGVEQAQLQGNTRELTTFTAAFSMDRGPLDMLVPIVHAGNTDAVLEEPWALHTSHVISENGWATTTTLLQLTATLDDAMIPGMERKSWTFLWDMPSIHASEATLAAMMAAFLHVVLCFIPPQSTSYLQPCDLAVSRGFKSCIQKQASTTLAALSSTAHSTTS